MELFDVLILSVHEKPKRIRTGITSKEFDTFNREWDQVKDKGTTLCLVPHYEEGLDDE